MLIGRRGEVEKNYGLRYKLSFKFVKVLYFRCRDEITLMS
jgi:hypothetical protein